MKVLLGKDGGGFTPAQVHDLGAAIMRSATVADVDGDGVDDHAVSTFGETSVANGTVHLFQGKTGTDAGFHVNPNWIANLNLEGFRPESLAFGQFGPVIEGPNGARSKLGLAFVNDPNSVAVFLSNGQGAFVQPTVVTTRLPKTAHLFLAGDFHSSSGADALQDLAFVSTDETGSDTLNFLMSNGAGGFADPVAELARNVGIGPHIGLAGQFDDSPPNDIAMIETPIDVVAQAPLGTLFRGKGEGRFSEITILLDESDQPVAMTAGRFSDQASNAPLDIAIADKSGKITLLVNNGEGKFLRANRRFSNVPFTPAALAPSDNLRGDGRSDLVVRDSASGRLTLLKNLGPVEQGESQFKDGGSFEAAGAPKDLLVGSIPGNDTADQLDHIVTYEGGTIRSFRANAQGFFDPPRDSMPNMGSFSIQPPYAIADFGNGKPALAVAATNSEALGIVQLKGDGAGGYTFATGFTADATPRGDLLAAGEETDFVQNASSAVGSKSERTVIAAIAGNFRSALHGNKKPDVAFITRLNTTSVEQEVCANDFEPQPPQPVVTPRTVCPMVEDPSEPGCDGPTPFPHCFSTGCCRCRDLSVPVGLRCPNSCNVPQPPPPPPPKPICTRTQAFAPVITVFANTCGD